jgi:hypothetical protein
VNLLRVGVFLGAVVVFLFASAAVAHYALDDFPNYGEALWSGLQHLLDPGALEGDQGTGERIIGVVQLLAGLVFIVGVLIAVLEGAISGSLARLTEGDPRVRATGHVVILGRTRLVSELVRELGAALTIGGGRDVAVVIPARLREDRGEIAEELEALAPELRLWVITGDPGAATFERASVRTAARIFVASGTQHSVEANAGDVETIGACFALREYLDGAERPPVHPVVRLGANVDAVAERLPASWDYVVVDRALGGIAGMAVSRPELAEMLTEPFGHGRGSGILYAVEAPDLAGRDFADAAAEFEAGLAVGVVPADGDVALAPDPDRVLLESDQIALLAPTRAAAQKRRSGPRQVAEVEAIELTGGSDTHERRVLAAGSPFAARALLEDLGGRSPQRFALTILHPRASELQLGELPGNVSVQRIDGPWAAAHSVRAAIAQARPDVVIVSADRRDGEDANPRALLAALHASRASEQGRAVPVVADLYSSIDPGIEQADVDLHVVARDAVLAKWMALLATDPASASATAALLDGEKVRIEAAICNPQSGKPAEFSAVYRSLLAQSVIPIGVAHPGERGRAEMNPPGDCPVEPGSVLIVIRRRRRQDERASGGGEDDAQRSS